MEENPYEGLRNLAFDATIDDLGLTKLKDNDVYGIIMDWQMGNTIVTLVTYKTGDASIYLSSGGAIIGGGQHKKVRESVNQFIFVGNKLKTQASLSDSREGPNVDCVRFFFLTSQGNYSAEEKMKNLENGRSKWLDLFKVANIVIGELRMVSEN